MCDDEDSRVIHHHRCIGWKENLHQKSWSVYPSILGGSFPTPNSGRGSTPHWNDHGCEGWHHLGKGNKMVVFNKKVDGTNKRIIWGCSPSWIGTGAKRPEIPKKQELRRKKQTWPTRIRSWLTKVLGLPKNQDETHEPECSHVCYWHKCQNTFCEAKVPVSIVKYEV